MVVEPFDAAGGLLEANIVEAGERCSGDVLDCVIGDEKMFLAENLINYLVRSTFEGLKQVVKRLFSNPRMYL